MDQISTPCFPRAASPLVAFVLLVASFANVAAADDLIVVDVDAHAVSPDQAGALLSFDPTRPSNSVPIVLAAADQGAPFEYLSCVAISRRDGSACTADTGILNPPVIHRVDCLTGAVTAAASDPRFVQPLGLTFLPDGRLVVVDWDADPSGLGFDDFGGTGHGAIFVVDLISCTTGCTVSVLSDGQSHPFGPGVRTAFEDPVAVQYDATQDRLLVADLSAPPSTGLGTSIYGIDIATGRVSLVSSDASWTALFALGIEPDGTILAVDDVGFPGGGSVWRVDPLLPFDRNGTILSGGAQYSFIEDVDVDSGGRIFVIDSGEWDPIGGTFIVPPALFEVDTTNGNANANGVLVNDSVELVNPIGIAARQGCTVPPGRLAINRSATRNAGSVRLQFVDGSCLQAPWSFCVDQFIDGALDGLILGGEGAQSSPESLRLYEHSDSVGTMKLRRVGADIVFSSN